MFTCVVFGVWYFDIWLFFHYLCFAIDKYMGHLICSYFVLKAWFGWIIGDFADVMPFGCVGLNQLTPQSVSIFLVLQL